MAYGTIYRLKDGERKLDSDTLRNLCVGFDCKLQDIFPDEFTKNNSDRSGLKPKPGQPRVWNPFNDPDLPPIRPVMAFLSFIFAQIGLFCRQIKAIASRIKVIA